MTRRWEFSLPEPITGRDCPIMLYLYCDESGKPHQSDVVSLCGYTIDHLSISQFSNAWNSCRERWIVPPIHLREIFHVGERLRPNRPDRWLQVKADWGKQWERKRDQMLSEFASIICETSLRAVGTVLDASHFMNENCVRLSGQVGGDPIHFAFRRTVLSCLKGVERAFGDPWLGIVIDDDKDSSLGFHEWVSKIKYGDGAPLGRWIRSLCFADDEGFPLLQAADMLAYAARQRQVPNGSAALCPAIYEKLTTNLAWEPVMLDATALDKLEREEVDV